MWPFALQDVIAAFTVGPPKHHRFTLSQGSSGALSGTHLGLIGEAAASGT